MPPFGSGVLQLAAAVALTLGAASGARAETIVVETGRVIDKDYYVYGERIEIHGVVTGDLYAAGGELIVSGEVRGDLLAAGQRITLSGRVGQDARLAAGAVEIGGTIGRNLTLAAGALRLGPNAAVQGGIAAAGGTITLDGSVNGEAKLAAGRAILGGRFARNVEAAADRVTLTSAAAIEGDLVYWSGRPAVIAPGARLAGAERRNPTSHFFTDTAGHTAAVIAGVLVALKLISLVSTLLLGLGALWLAPRFTRRAVEALRAEPLEAFGWGAAVAILAPVAIGLLAVTLIGLPLALVAFALYSAALYSARPFGLIAFGAVLLERSDSGERPIAALLTGTLIYAVVSFIPFVSVAAWIVATIAGLGALLRANQSESHAAPDST